MVLESIVERDIQSLRKLQPDGWADIIPIFEYYIKMPFCKPVKVMLENRIVGVGSGISLGNTAWLAHIIVDPGFRKRGIGGFIVVQLLNCLKNSGCETVSLIATELGYPVYKKAGFVEQTEYVFFEREEPLKDYYRSENIVRLIDTKTEDIFYLDKKISGEDRSKLLIHRLENCYVYQRKGKIIGFYLPDIGEGLIVADDIKAGIELMKFKYSASNKGVLPLENIEGNVFLKENGFVESKKAIRMIIGKEFPWHPDKIFSRIGGNLG